MKCDRPCSINETENPVHKEDRPAVRKIVAKAEPAAGKEAAQIVRRLIRRSHGNAKLNFGSMARELGIEVRTLQRYFRQAFGMNMKQYTVQTRMKFAAHLLAQKPSPKVSFVASRLGYETDRGFLRFVAGRIERHRSGTKPGKKKQRSIQSARDKILDLG